MLSRLPIFSETTDGQLLRLRPSAPPTEDSLQDLIARFPQIVAGEDDELLLLRREQPVPDREDGSGRWSLDHLFVSRSAIPVLVEVKRATDTRLRREVIGQLLDYAANGVAYWPAGALEQAFRETCISNGEEPDLKLSDFLGDERPEEFWGQVDANLASGRIRLVVTADVIPNELAKILEFLNEQMRADVIGVELNYFEADDGRRTLAPRIIGETQRAKSSKGSKGPALPEISREEWIDLYIAPLGETTLAGARKLLDLLAELGGEVFVASTQGSIGAVWHVAADRKAYPFFLQRNGNISIGFGWLKHCPGLADEARRAEYLARFKDVLGPLSTNKASGHPAFPASLLLDETIFERFSTLARELIKAASVD